MVLVTTCPVSSRHVAKMKEIASELDVRVFPSIAEALPELPEAEILITYGEDLTAEIVAGCPQLKWIHVLSAGLELMPFGQIEQQNILVTNARGIHVGPMSEYTLGLILMFSRRFVEMFHKQRAHDWDRTIRIDELDGQTLGVIGAGAIGSKIAERAKLFGMTTLGVATAKRSLPEFDELFDRSGLDEVLTRSDYVVVIVPMTAETNGLLGAREIGLMKESAVLINIARGNVVDEAALLTALQEKKIRGAGLDVFQQEPLPEDHPFWELDNVVLTPHISSRSPKYMERAQAIFLHNLAIYAGAPGMMQNVIDVKKGY
ncbi:phosphoglycerate dehydrogenase-like enzyme [Tumebacillus sp. BK434]|uniref:D-2-hydroxyacid dehydrogenase n=1 Tax=Tumebacillus sp. BK434 TaxID=2512169 RepID=UPI0010E69B37|nr:D-2-hydroxyacid dehydrogenase [Tumebacillus sp. BK434]TCP53818.1 phosphoglycerate dehydrogenase-like enzyme [Tumebacillus sp. BK434]